MSTQRKSPTPSRPCLHGAALDADPDPCSEADFFDPETWEGVDPLTAAAGLEVPSPGDRAEDRLRLRKLSNEAYAELSDQLQSWTDLANLNDVEKSTFRRCFTLHQACLVSLLSRLGAVR
jgi:hypothetical protein